MKGIWAGSYDPPTNGHLWMITRSARLFTKFLCRGIGNEKDYTYERSMRYDNGNMTDTIQTLFMMSPRNLVEVASRLVKGLLGSDDWEPVFREYVPDTEYYKYAQQIRRHPSPAYPAENS